jgi:thiol-disulfide isomerase/thioredoxin
MNKPIQYFLILVLLLVWGNGKVWGQDGTTIKITVKGIKKDSTYYIGNYYGDKQYIVDSAKADGNGNLIFRSTEKLPSGIYFFVPPARNTFLFEFIVHEHNFSLETDTSDYDGKMKIKNSRENEIFYEYRNYLAQKSREVSPFSKRLKEIDDILNPKDSTDSKDGKNKDKKPVKKAPPPGTDTIALKKEREQLLEKLRAVNKEVINYQKSFIEKYKGTLVATIFRATQEPDIPEPRRLENGKIDSLYPWRYYRSRYLDFVDFSQPALLRTPIYKNKIDYFLDKLTIQDPDSVNSAIDYIIDKTNQSMEIKKWTISYLMGKFEKSKLMFGESNFVHIVQKYVAPNRDFWGEKNVFTKQDFWYPDTSLDKIIKRAVKLEPILLNKIAPDLTMYDKNGKPVSLHKTKGKYTLLIFWDSNCGHCKEVTPKIHDIYLRFRDKGFNVYAANIETKQEGWKKFIEEKGFQWINVQDIYGYSNFREIYDIYKTPIIYLLDENKKILFKHLSHEQVEEFLKDKLK